MVEHSDSRDKPKSGRGAVPQDASVTILIRAKNEERFIGQCLERISRQATDMLFDVLLIDSGSTDATVEIARQFDFVSVHEIAPESFNYGGALNLGVQLARGEYVVSLSAHCIPIGDGWLDALIAPLERDPQLAATFGRQVPWPGCEPVERHMMQGMFRETSARQLACAEIADPMNAVFSNANCSFRRQLALQQPFQTLPWAEDRVWASQILDRGLDIAYVADAAVHHSHQRSVRDYLRIGLLQGRAAALSGGSQRRLKSFVWFGPRKLYWTILHWRRLCRQDGAAPAKATIQALQCVARIMTVNVGTWYGYRRESRRMRAYVKFPQGAGLKREPTIGEGWSE
jgi:rhamnosyltransferase